MVEGETVVNVYEMRRLLVQFYIQPLIWNLGALV